MNITELKEKLTKKILDDVKYGMSFNGEQTKTITALLSIIEEMNNIIKDAHYIFEVSIADKSLSEKELDKRHDALERFCMFDLTATEQKLKELGEG